MNEDGSIFPDTEWPEDNDDHDDAERYRFLCRYSRDELDFKYGIQLSWCLRPNKEELDAKIDAAMEKEKNA